MTDQIESENAALLRDLDSAAAGIQRMDRLDAEHITKTIRALEAKAAAAEAAVREKDDVIFRQAETIGGLRADRDRLAEQTALLEQHIGLLKAENANYLIGRDRLAGEVERLEEYNRNNIAACKHIHDMWVTSCDEFRAEVARLAAELLVAQTRASEVTSELAAARENEARYLWLRDSGYVGPNLTSYTRIGRGYSPTEIEAAIDAARRAGDASETGSIRQSRKGEK